MVRVRTSVGVLADVAVAVAIPDVNTEVLGLVGIEWSQTLVPASVHCSWNWDDSLLSVAALLAVSGAKGM